MDKLIAAIMIITGAASPDELDESVMERFDYYAEHPLDINASGRGRLEDSGMMNSFQIASLLEYRERAGGIMSVTELGAVDGFGEKYARALSAFITFEGRAEGPPRVDSRLVTRRYSRSDKDSCPYGVKYFLSAGESFELGFASRTTYSESDFSIGSASVALYGKRHPWKIIIGDFNARFGQGLVMWNGFSLSTHSTSSSLVRNPTGISLSRSYSGALRGAAADFDFGSVRLAAAGTVAGDAILHGGTGFLSSTVGMTLAHHPDRLALSVDFRSGFKGGAVFGEFGYDREFKALAGAFVIPSYGTEVAVLSKYSEAEQFLAAAFSSPRGDLFAEASGTAKQRKLRTGFLYRPEFGVWGFVLSPSLRFVEKISEPDVGQPTLRSDARFDLEIGRGDYSVHTRVNWVHCVSDAWLWYAELGRKGALSVFLRGTLFLVDHWDDRIYVYERDAPGTFNVPAYYGRGWNASLVSSYRKGPHRLDARVSEITYPAGDRQDVLEFRLQYSLNLPIRHPGGRK